MIRGTLLRLKQDDIDNGSPTLKVLTKDGISWMRIDWKGTKYLPKGTVAIYLYRTDESPLMVGYPTNDYGDWFTGLVNGQILHGLNPSHWEVI